MNILIITQMYAQPDDIGDNKPTKTVNYFAKEWKSAGHNVVVAHCSSKFPLILYLIPNTIKNKISGSSSKIIPPIESRKALHRDENGIDVYRLPMLKIIPGQAYSIVKLKSQAKKICNILDNKRFIPELVVGHFANPSAELVAEIAEHYKAKSSIVFHQDCTVKNTIKYRISDSIKRIGAIGARSIIEANQIKGFLSPSKLPFVCCSGVPNDEVEACAKTCTKQDFSNGVKYIYVGSLIKRKHLDAVIKAFVEKYKNSNFATLEVVGGGPEEESLKALTNRLNANDIVTFTGRVTREEVLARMRKAHVFTLISDDEVFGMVYIEAMLQGCLTIASKGGGFDGIIVDGENGFICNPGDIMMLKSIYNRICDMTIEERNRIGQNAIDTAVKYSEKAVAVRYLNDVLERNRLEDKR